MISCPRTRKFGRLFSSPMLAALLLLPMVGCGGGGGGGGFNPSTNISVVIFPASTSVPVGSTINFTATVYNTNNTAVNWTATNGATFAGSVMTAPGTAGMVTVTATSQADATKTATATVTVTSATTVIVSPAAVAVPAKGQQHFTAAAGGLAVTWQLQAPPPGVDFGTIDQSGNYTAPQVPPPGGAVAISASTAAGAGVANVTIVFSNASLNGQFAFSYAGQDAGGFLAVAGSLTFDGLGGILNGGVEDVNSAAGTATNPILGGTYVVGPDGRTTASFNTNAATVSFLFTIISPRHALLVRFDTTATGSGTLDLQNKVDLSGNANNIAGFYSFGLSGINSVGTSEAIAGNLFADGNGNFPINNAVQDVNNGGTVTQADTSLHGQILTFDSSSGRGQLEFTSTAKNTLAFAFYMVDRTHLKLVETDTFPVLAGDMFAAPNSVTLLSLNGNNAFTVGGSVSRGAYAAGGIFTSNGTGGITAGNLDLNANGSVHNVTVANANSTYTVNPLTSHRLLVNISDGNTTFIFGVYPNSDGSAVMIELDASVVVASGMAFPQTSAAQPQGNYAFNLSAAVGTGEEDVDGAIATTGTTVVTGYLDANSTGSLFSNLLLSGSTIVSPSLLGRGTVTLQTAAPSSATFPLAYYVVDDQTVLVIEIDGQRVATGVMPRQF